MGIGNKFNLPLQYQDQYDFDAFKDNIVDFTFTRERPRHILFGYSDNERPDATIDHVKDVRNYTSIRDMATPSLGDTLSSELLLGAEYGFSGLLGSDVGGAAFKRSYLTDTSGNPYAELERSYENRPPASPEAGIPRQLLDKFTSLYSSGTALANLFLGTSPYQDIIDNLSYQETDENYLDAAGEFDSMKYFTDTFAENYHLMSTLDRVGFSKDEILRTKNKRNLEYLVLRAVGRSALEDKIAKYDESSGFFNGAFGRMLMNLPALIYNDPDLPATLGIGTAVKGAFSVGKASLKAISKQLGKELTQETLDSFTRQALRKKTGVAAARIFQQAGKSNAFAKYVQAGFKLEANALKRYKVLDFGVKGAILGGFQGGVSDLVSQKNIINEANLYGGVSDSDRDFDYGRLLMATAASAVFGGAIGGLPGFFMRPRNASIDSARNLSSSLTDVSEAQIAAGRSYVEGTPLLEELSVSKSANEAEAKQTVRDISRDVEKDDRSPLIKAVDNRDPEVARYVLSEAKENPNDKLSDIIKTKDVSKKQKFVKKLRTAVEQVEKRIAEKPDPSPEDINFLNSLKARERAITGRLDLEKEPLALPEAIRTTEQREGVVSAHIKMNREDSAAFKETTSKAERTKVKKRQSNATKKLTKKEKAHAKKSMTDDAYFASISKGHEVLLDTLNSLVNNNVISMNVMYVLRGIFSNENSKYLQNLTFRSEKGELIVTKKGIKTEEEIKAEKEFAQENLEGAYYYRGGDTDLETQVIFNLESLKQMNTRDQISLFLHEIAGHAFHDSLPVSLRRQISRMYSNGKYKDALLNLHEKLFDTPALRPKEESSSRYFLSNEDEFFAKLTEIVLFDRYDRSGLIDYANSVSLGLDPNQRYNFIKMVSDLKEVISNIMLKIMTQVLDSVEDLDYQAGFGRRLDNNLSKFVDDFDDLRSFIEEEFTFMHEADGQVVFSGNYLSTELNARRAMAGRSEMPSFLKEASKMRNRFSGVPKKLFEITEKVFSSGYKTTDEFVSDMNNILDFARESGLSKKEIMELEEYLQNYTGLIEVLDFIPLYEIDGSDVRLKDLLNTSSLLRVVLDPFRFEAELYWSSIYKTDAEIKKAVDADMVIIQKNLQYGVDEARLGAFRHATGLKNIDQNLGFLIDSDLIRFLNPSMTQIDFTGWKIATENNLKDRAGAVKAGRPDPGGKIVIDAEAAKVLLDVENAFKKGTTLENIVKLIKVKKGQEDLISMPFDKLKEMLFNGTLVSKDGKLQRATISTEQAVAKIALDDTLKVVSQNKNNPTEAVSDQVLVSAKKASEAIQKGKEDAALSRSMEEEGIKDSAVPLTEDGQVDVVTFLSSEKNLNSIKAVLRASRIRPEDAEDAVNDLFIRAAEGKVNPDPAQTTSTKKLINFLARGSKNKVIDRVRKEQGFKQQEDGTKKATISSMGEDPSAASVSDPSALNLLGAERGEAVRKTVFAKLDDLLQEGYLNEKDIWFIKKDFEIASVKSQIEELNTEKARLVSKKNKKTASEEELLELKGLLKEIEGLKKQSGVTVKELSEQYNAVFQDSPIKPGSVGRARTRARKKFSESGEIEVNFERTPELISQPKPESKPEPKVEAVVEEVMIEETTKSIENEASTGILDVSVKEQNEAASTTITSDDSSSTVRNTKEIKKAESGKTIVLGVHTVKTNKKPSTKTKIATTNKPKAEANRADVETKETGSKETTVIESSTVKINNPVVIKEAVTKTEDLIDSIPNNLLLSENVDVPVLKATLKNTIQILRELESVFTRQDEYDFLVKYLKDNHGIDAVVRIDGQEATVFLPADTPRTNVSNEVHTTTGKVETDTIKIDEEAKFKNEDGTEKPLDQKDDHVIQNGEEVREEVITETESSVRDVEQDSLQDQIEAFILSDDGFLNNLGADISLVSRLLELFPDYVTSYKKVSALVGGFLLETKKIMDKNLANYGDEGVKLYWKTVLEIRMENDVLKQRIADMKVKGETVNARLLKKVKTVDEIYESASMVVTREFKDEKKSPFLSPLAPEKYDPVTGSRTFETAQQRAQREVTEIGGGSKKRTILRKFFNKKSGDNHRYVRAQGLIGAIFGGEDSSSTNWWRKAMTNIVLFAQVGNGLKDTIYSHVDVLMALSKFVDSTKLHTGHFISGGKRPIKTWMQSDSLVKRRMGRLTQRNARVLKFSKKAYPSVMKYVYDTRINKGKINKGDLIKAIEQSEVPSEKVNQLAERLFPVLEEYNNELTDVYRTIFDLQEETGWKFINEIEGSDKLNPETYVPITLDPNRIQDNLDEVVQAMTNVRRKSIQERDTIHRSLMYALGWLPSTFDDTDPVSALFRKDRDIDGQAIKNNKDLLSRVVETELDADSLNNLTLVRSLTNPLDSVGANERLYGTLGRDWFVVKQENEYLIVKIPNKIEELSVADRSKYKKAIEGEVTDYVPSILSILKTSKNTDIIQAEMMELMSFKLGRGVYGSGVKIGVNNTPILGLADPAKKGSGVWIQNITPEEMMMDSTLSDYMQINPTMSTLDFMNGRLFELHSQRELDRLLGSKGIRMYEFLSEAEEIAINRIENEGHSSKDTDMLVKSVKNGVEKLKEQYSMYSQHISQIDDNYSALSVNAGTLSQNLLTSAVSWGFGILALTETVLVKSGQGINNAQHPTQIIKDAALMIRNILGDLRFDRAADRIEVADTIFAFDLLNRNNSARFLSDLDESVELTTSLKEKLFGPSGGGVPERINTGAMGVVQRRVSNLAYFAREIGSLQQVTNANRMIATPKYTRMFIKVLQGNKIDDLINVLETKEVRNKIKKLEEEAATDRSKQAELVKYIKGLAREVGGMDYQTVAPLLQYGLLNKNAINALRMAFKESGIKVEGGRIDFMRLNNFVLDLRTNKKKVDGLDPDVLEDAIDSLTYMIEQLVITREITETQGLAKGTGVISRHPIGRLLTSLFGWINAFHYNVFTNYGNRTSPKYLIGTLMMAGIANAVAMTFRQWIRGRDPEDILMEMEEDPLRFLALSIQGIPALGRFNSIIDGGVAGVQMMVGSTPQHLFSPFGVPGLEALPKAATDISRGFNKTYDYITGENNTSGVDAAAALTKSAQLDGMLNNSFLALPVRVFESADIIKEGNALREYLDTLQFAETPYQDLTKRSRTKGKIKDIDNIMKSSLREDMTVMKANKENLERSLKIDKTTPQQMKERVQRNFSIETGDFYRSPRKAEMTPEAPETLESLRGPSRASENLADFLEENENFLQK